MVGYRGLVTLGLELLKFDLEEVKNLLVEILRVHSDSLRHLWLGRNKISNELLRYISTELRGSFNVLESVHLLHLVELKNVKLVDLLQSLSLLREGKTDYPLRVYISDYQAKTNRAELLDYLTQNSPNLELHFI